MDFFPRFTNSGKAAFPHIIDSFSKWLNKVYKEPDADKSLSLLLFGAAVIEYAGVPIVGKTINGTIVTWNKGAEKFFGYTAQETIGQPIKLILPTGYEEEHAQIVERIQAGEQMVSLETQRLSKDGLLLDIALISSPVRDPEGNLLGISSVSHDLVRQKQTQEELQAAARFPSENPNPVLRVSNDGVFIYGNDASSPVQAAWNCQIGDVLPQPWYDVVSGAAQSGQTAEQDLECGDTMFHLQFVPITGHDYVNIYGRDITQQKQAEEVLRESEARLRATFDHAAMGIVEVDGDGRFVVVNNRICQILDYSRDELLQMSLHDLTAPEDWAVTDELNTVLRQGKTDFFDYEKRYLKHDGSRLWVHVTVSAIRDGDGRFLRAIATIEDISDRKEAEFTIRNQANLLEQVHDAIFIWEGDNKITHWYQGAVRLYGWSREEALGKKAYDLLQTVFPIPLEEIAQILQSEGEWIGELKHVAKNGRKVIVESHLKLVQFGGEQRLVMEVTRDVTERKWIEQIARESHDIVVEQRQKLKTILEALPVGVTTTDRLGHIKEVNGQARQIWGTDPADTSIDQYDDYKGWWADSGKPVKPGEWPLARAILKGEVSTGEAIDLERFDGQHVPVLVSAAPIHDERGEITGGVLVLSDITERRQIENQLRYQAMLLENVTDAIFSTDLNFKVVSWNKAAEKMYGWSLDELIEQDTDLGKILKTGYPAGLTSQAVRHQFFEQGRWQGELSRQRKDGIRLDVQASVQMLFDLSGSMIGLVSVERNITQSKRAEKALKESEERFRQLADSMPQLVWTARADGTVDYYNQRSQEFSGIQPGPGDSWEWSPALHEDDKQSTVEAWQHAVQTGQMYQIEHRVYRVDGSLRWYLSRGIPVRDAQGRIVRWYGTTTDIHEQKVAEQRTVLLQELTAALSQAATIEEIAVVVVNKALQAVGGHLGSVAMLTPDGSAIELVSTYGTPQETYRRFQRTPLDFPAPLTDAIRLGKAVWIETQEEYVTRYPSLAAIVTETTGSYASACLPLIVDEQVIGGMGISFSHPVSFTHEDRDFLQALAQQSAQAIQRARLYEVVLQERNKLWTLLDSMTEEVWFYDADGKVVLLNQAAVNGLGLDLPLFHPIREHLGRFEVDNKIDDYSHVIDASLFARTLHKGETLKDVEMFAQHPQTGERRFWQTSAAPIKNEVGDIVGAVVVARDITDQKRAEQQTRDLIAERERMRALTEFVQNVSHDFKTPLSILKTSLYLLDKVSDPGKQQRQIMVMEQQTQRLTNLLEGMLSMTRLDQEIILNLQVIDLNHLIDEIHASKLSLAAQKGLTTQIKPSEESLEIQADIAELEQALLNILDNAIQYTPLGGMVTLRTSRKDTMAVIEILDTGIGISKADLPHIFERLYRADKARSTATGGVGLGLSIAQKIIQLHGGDIIVSSMPDKGTTIRILLPVAG